MVFHLLDGSEMAAHPLVFQVMCHLSLFSSRDQGHSLKQLPNYGTILLLSLVCLAFAEGHQTEHFPASTKHVAEQLDEHGGYLFMLL